MFHKRQWQCWVKGFWELHFTSLGSLLTHESEIFAWTRILLNHIDISWVRRNLSSSTTVVASKRTQRNLLLTLSSSKRMGNSCGCTEQMFYTYFLGVSPPYGEGAILMVSNYLSCFVTLWLLGLILWERKYRKKSNNETPDWKRENGKSWKKSTVSCWEKETVLWKHSSREEAFKKLKDDTSNLVGFYLFG